MKVFFIFALSAYAAGSLQAAVNVVLDPQATPREAMGASRLRSAVEGRLPNARILAGTETSSVFAGRSGIHHFAAGESEAYHLDRAGNDWLVIGSDPSGVLYGCLELASRVAAAGGPPARLDVTDRPAFRIRGTNLFWMKWGERGYNWPITPENFPWFFDRAMMTRYLDELAKNRFNTIYFWSGHPFPFFLKLPRYPEARMLTDADLKRNIEQLQWFTTEADRRGIWTVFHFYNIHVSPAFAKAHENEGVRVENAASTPLLEAYMRYCVSEFVNSYPNVGLMLTAGEALRVRREEFVRDAIIPGIKDTGKHPPLIVRQWQIDPYRYRDVIKPNYDNLFTMMKHNTEMVVSPYPDPRHKIWISYGQSHIVNVHENSDLKPFRWGSPVFIRQMIEQWKEMGVSGFHLYPMVSWLWPDALDRVQPALSTMDRDRVWLEAFGRYGWQPDRPPDQEETLWKQEFAQRFASKQAGEAVYRFYVRTGPILPGLQNVVNIYNMNFHPTAVSQEATLNGILHSDRWEGVGDYLARPLDDLTLGLYESRFGKIGAAARAQPPLSVKDALKPHAEGIDPLKLSQLFVEMAEGALASLEKAESSVGANREEYARFINDNRCIALLARFYQAKLEAAFEKGLYDRGAGSKHFTAMLEKLDESLSAYQKLDDRATAAYRLATDLGGWYQWKTVRRSFEEEAAFYHQQASLAPRGAEVVYLGLDGPMSEAGNAFHWPLEHYRKAAGWSAQSYAFGENPFARAKLVVVYDFDEATDRRYGKQLEDWVRGGGKLFLFDPTARLRCRHFLEGVRFRADAGHRNGARIAFTSAPHALLNGLASVVTELDPAASFPASIRELSPEWRELAYTVLPSTNSRQFYIGYETFGPRWTSLMDPARVPVIVARPYGSGEVVLAQVGSPLVGPSAKMPADHLDAAPEFIRKLAQNLVAWAR